MTEIILKSAEDFFSYGFRKYKMNICLAFALRTSLQNTSFEFKIVTTVDMAGSWDGLELVSNPLNSKTVIPVV
jgi:hypothetical protein